MSGILIDEVPVIIAVATTTYTAVTCFIALFALITGVGTMLAVYLHRQNLIISSLPEIDILGPVGTGYNQDFPTDITFIIINAGTGPAKNIVAYSGNGPPGNSETRLKARSVLAPGETEVITWKWLQQPRPKQFRYDLYIYVDYWSVFQAKYEFRIHFQVRAPRTVDLIGGFTLVRNKPRLFVRAS